MHIAYILNVFPKLSETFIINEIRALQRRDISIEIYALFRPKREEANLEVGDLVDKTFYLSTQLRFYRLAGGHLYFFLHFPLRYLDVLFYCISKQNVSFIRSICQVLRASLRGRQKSNKIERQNPLLHFILAVPFALLMLKGQYDLLHAHFADAATSFALIISRLSYIPYSFTTHAFDLFSEQPLMSEKIAKAQLIVTCTEYNGRYLRENLPAALEKVHVLYHGLDLPQFTMPGKRKAPVHPILLLIGRLVKKKGTEI